MKSDGGPAFPQPTQDYLGVSFNGMSMRDWFAGQAMAGILANKRMGDTLTDGEIASSAFTIADAMLAEREKK